MAYTSSDDVLEYASKFNIAFGSDPSDDHTTAQIDAIISQFEAHLNGVLLARNYSTVPATGANDTEMLKRFVAQRVAAWAYMDVFTNHEEFPATVKLWVKEWTDFITMLGQGRVHLIDQAGDPAGNLRVINPKVLGA